jgi:hypothetical protein
MLRKIAVVLVVILAALGDDGAPQLHGQSY